MRILAVDDDQLILEILRDGLQQTGYNDSQFATSAFEALEIIDTSESIIDCFLIDIRMPEMNGIELCKAIRGREIYKHQPIIMVTALSEKEYVDDAFKAGATDYISKPFDALELRTRLKLAQRLVYEHRELQDSQSSTDLLLDELSDQLPATLAMAHDLDVNGFIEYRAFANYLSQMSRGSMLRTTLATVRIRNIQEIFEYVKLDEFVDVIEASAKAISQSFLAGQKMFSYGGNGVFFCAYHGKRYLVPEVVQRTAEANANHQLAVNGFRREVGVELEFSNPRRLGLGHTENPEDVLRSVVGKYSCDLEVELETSQPSPERFISKQRAEEFVRSVKPKFLTLLSQNLGELERLQAKTSGGSAAKEEAEKLKFLAHRVAGAAPIFGFAELGKIALNLESEIEDSMHNGRLIPAKIVPLLDAIMEEIESVVLNHFSPVALAGRASLPAVN